MPLVAAHLHAEEQLLHETLHMALCDTDDNGPPPLATDDEGTGGNIIDFWWNQIGPRDSDDATEEPSDGATSEQRSSTSDQPSSASPTADEPHSLSMQKDWHQDTVCENSKYSKEEVEDAAEGATSCGPGHVPRSTEPAKKLYVGACVVPNKNGRDLLARGGWVLRAGEQGVVVQLNQDGKPKIRNSEGRIKGFFPKHLVRIVDPADAMVRLDGRLNPSVQAQQAPLLPAAEALAVALPKQGTNQQPMVLPAAMPLKVALPTTTTTVATTTPPSPPPPQQVVQQATTQICTPHYVLSTVPQVTAQNVAAPVALMVPSGILMQVQAVPQAQAVVGIQQSEVPPQVLFRDPSMEGGQKMIQHAVGAHDFGHWSTHHQARGSL